MALILGAALIGIGIMGFFPNSLIGPGGYFPSDTALNCLHLVLGVLLLGFTTKGESTAATGLYTVGMLAMAVAIVGFVGIDTDASGPTLLFNTVRFSLANVYLAAGMAALCVFCGTLNTSSSQLIRD